MASKPSELEVRQSLKSKPENRKRKATSQLCISSGQAYTHTENYTTTHMRDINKVGLIIMITIEAKSTFRIITYFLRSQESRTKTPPQNKMTSRK